MRDHLENGTPQARLISAAADALWQKGNLKRASESLLALKKKWKRKVNVFSSKTERKNKHNLTPEQPLQIVRTSIHQSWLMKVAEA